MSISSRTESVHRYGKGTYLPRKVLDLEKYPNEQDQTDDQTIRVDNRTRKSVQGPNKSDKIFADSLWPEAPSLVLHTKSAKGRELA